MRAAVTRGPGAIEVVDVADPRPPGPGEVLVAPEVVGVCGSDVHLFKGELDVVGNPTLPRVQGHELSAVVVAAGKQVRRELREPGTRVAMWPLKACGRCYPCRVNRPNVCDAFELVGIHVDGGLAERLVVPESQLFPIAVEHAESAALAEPASIAIRAITRARVREEPVVVLGAGPIGQLVALAALDAGARVLVVDPMEERLAYARGLGAETHVWGDRASTVAAATEWAREPGGVPCVIDATGNPDAIAAAVEMAVSAGRVAIVGMTGAQVSLPVVAFVAKELDVLGVSVCQAGEFARAVALLERHQERARTLVSHRYDLDRTGDALTFAMTHPQEAMKVVVTV